MWRRSVLCQSGHGAKDWMETERRGEGESACVRTPRLVFHAKVAEETGNSSVFSKRGRKGDGEARRATEAREVRFYSVRNDTARLSGGCTDVLLTRRGGKEGVQRVRLYRRIPGTVSNPDTTTDSGAETTAPLRVTRRTWHAPLCPSLPPPPH